MEKITLDDLVKMGLGTILLAKERAEGLIDEAIKQGEVSKEDAENFFEDLKKSSCEKTKEFDKKIKEEIHEELKSLGLATKEDITSLKKEITALKKVLQER